MQTRRSRGCLMRLWRLAEGNGFTRLCAGQIAFSLRLMFSFGTQKRTKPYRNSDLTRATSARIL